MAYSELIKRFERVRDYMRDFFIYGYKTRADFDTKSARTYDNERRRVEGLAGPYMHFETGRSGKTAFFSLDSSRLRDNPLHAAWQSKSFTDNDIQLHFFILDVLADGGAYSADEMTDEINRRYCEEFDTQTVRNKLREYEAAHLLRSQRNGKAILYAQPDGALQAALDATPGIDDMVAFFCGAAPLGVIGSYILGQRGTDNAHFLFKHRFLAQTLDDGILLALLRAMVQGRQVRLTSAGRRQRTTQTTGLPVKILRSTQTGRQYVLLDRRGSVHHPAYRLDYIRTVEPLDVDPDAEAKRCAYEARRDTCWGISHAGARLPERIEMTIAADEATEGYIIQRLQRERRHGDVERVSPGVYRYTAMVNDTSELLPWLRSYTGRILSLEGDNTAALRRFRYDLLRICRQYGEERGDR